MAKKGTAELAKAYLQYLYSDEGQEIAAKHSIRPRSPAVLKKYAATFKPIKLFTVQELFGCWRKRRRCTSTTAASSTRSTR